MGLHNGTPALEADTSLGEEPDGPGIESVLGFEDSLGERFGGVLVEDGDRLLEQDGPRVESLVDEVDRRTRDLDAMLAGLRLGVLPRKGRQQGGVDVEDAAAKRADEDRREDSHEAGEADEVDALPRRSAARSAS